jgi:AcrR family transcriptional regulator
MGKPPLVGWQNNILSMENPSLPDYTDVASRIARQTLDKRGPDYTGEVRRLIDAGRMVMRRCGTDSRPRVADIVAEAGLSNEGFYRHFASKDALVAAILDDGTERLLSYLAHQMAKERTPVGRVRCWVEGVLSQAADDESAATTLAVLWNAASLGQAMSVPHTSTSARLATLLREPFAELRCDDPVLDAELVAHAVIGLLNDLLWGRRKPTRGQTDRLTDFCLAACTAGHGPDGGAAGRRSGGR